MYIYTVPIQSPYSPIQHQHSRIQQNRTGQNTTRRHETTTYLFHQVPKNPAAGFWSWKDWRRATASASLLFRLWLMRPEKSVLLLAAPGVVPLLAPLPAQVAEAEDVVVDAVALDELCGCRVRRVHGPTPAAASPEGKKRDHYVPVDTSAPGRRRCCSPAWRWCQSPRGSRAT